MPWILAALVCAKVSAASWIAVRLQSSRLLSDRALVMGAASWLVAVLALYLVLGVARPRTHHPALLPHAARDPGRPAGAGVGGTARLRVESAPVTALAASGEPRRRTGVIGAVLALIGLPAVLALAEAVSFYVSNRSNGCDRLIGRGARVPAPCPGELRPHPADAARHHTARRGDVAGRSAGLGSLEPGGRRARVHRGIPVRTERPGTQGVAGRRRTRAGSGTSDSLRS